MSDAQEFRSRLAQVAPTLWCELTAKAAEWIAPLTVRLDSGTKDRYPKTFNDPIWGDIVLFPWETLLLDSPLLQRLRGVRQLGMAHLVYPGAGYDRLEHSRGVVEAAERMVRSLERNAEFRRKFGKDRDESDPFVSDHDRISIRLAALVHDIGHSAFSHATEGLIQSRLAKEFEQVRDEYRRSFSGVTSIAPAEVVALILIMSEPLRRVFEHPHFEATSVPAKLPLTICARILGSRDYLNAGFLFGVISGPLDADKLDYMARDCHHSGLPVGLDLNRLISKLEVVTVTPETACNPEMKARAETSPNRRFHEIGISLSGLGAYEQMVIGRVILYDRLYYHHKVRSAEAMVRRLIRLAEQERGQPFSVRELFFDHPDDTVILVLGGRLTDPTLRAGGPRSAKLATAILNRAVYYRAFAFAPRFVGGLRGLPEEEKRDVRALLCNTVLGDLSSIEGCDKLAEEIFRKATRLRERIGGLTKTTDALYPEHVVVDLPVNKTVVRGGDILTRTEDGYVAPPHLFFDPERWSQAYEHQKQCGFVYTPREFVRLVGLAARIVFFERYELLMDTTADRASKTAGEIRPEWFQQAAVHGLCTGDCAAAYQQDMPRLVPIREDDLSRVVPDELKREDSDFVRRLRTRLHEAIPIGLAPSVHRAVLDGIGHLLRFLRSLAQNGDFVAVANLKEAELQARLRSHLEARDAAVTEGSKLGGGATDLVLSRLVVIENKVIRTPTAAPLTVGEAFSWQTRRYSIALSTRIALEMVAYKPSGETAVLPLTESISIRTLLEGSSTFAIVRFVTPWGQSVPSAAKPPE